MLFTESLDAEGLKAVADGDNAEFWVTGFDYDDCLSEMVEAGGN